MSRIYSSTNRIRFTDIPEKYAIPRAYKGLQCEVHSAVVTYVYDNFKNTKKYRNRVVDVLNYLTFSILVDGNLPTDINFIAENPIDTMPNDVDMDEVEKGLGDLYLTDEAIEWSDIPISQSMIDEDTKVSNVSNSLEFNHSSIVPTTNKNDEMSKPITYSNKFKVNTSNQSFKAAPLAASTNSTPKEDLYIQPPKYPTFDVSKIWMSKVLNGNEHLVIYTTLPEIPTKQNEISCTTNVKAMTDKELLNLFPDHVIHTRSPKMYEKVEGLDFDEDLGIIIPIEGFTKEEIVDNIIQYPHLYKLKKFNEIGQLVNFYTTLEVDGKLVPVSEIWNSLPESKVLPCDSEFAKEYVVRRYLLEEDHGIVHKYELFGTLDPFLTLFMPPVQYARRGYKNSVELAKACVTSRVRYKQSRNPILRRMNVNA